MDAWTISIGLLRVTSWPVGLERCALLESGAAEVGAPSSLIPVRKLRAACFLAAPIGFCSLDLPEAINYCRAAAIHLVDWVRKESVAWLELPVLWVVSRRELITDGAYRIRCFALAIQNRLMILLSQNSGYCQAASILKSSSFQLN